VEGRIDEAFFLGGMAKHGVSCAFNPHIFFDDQPVYCEPALHVVPAARVLYKL
jgi:5'-nucleotidase